MFGHRDIAACSILSHAACLIGMKGNLRFSSVAPAVEAIARVDLSD